MKSRKANKTREETRTYAGCTILGSGCFHTLLCDLNH
jgi:hypothetical protein